MHRRFRSRLACASGRVAIALIAASGANAHARTAAPVAPGSPVASAPAITPVGPASPLNPAPGPAIGTRIPEFGVPDHDGKVQTFDTVRGPKGAVIYFHRSADWCIYCKMQLIELEASRAAIERNGYGLVAISFDDRQALEAFADERSLGFPLLSDPGSRLIRRFGLLDASVAPDNPAYGVPVHGSLLVDENGIVRGRYFDSTSIHSAGVTLTRLFTSAYNTHERIVTHDHVKLRYSASRLAARAGDQLELALEIVPRGGAVLHADDAGARRVALTWQMEQSPLFSRGPADYPQPVEMQIAGKRVHMYRDTLQLSMPIVLTTDRQQLAAGVDSSSDLVLNGTLSFQACVADQCHSPRTIPLRWKVQFTP